MKHRHLYKNIYRLVELLALVLLLAAVLLAWR